MRIRTLSLGASECYAKKGRYGERPYIKRPRVQAVGVPPNLVASECYVTLRTLTVIVSPQESQRPLSTPSTELAFSSRLPHVHLIAREDHEIKNSQTRGMQATELLEPQYPP